MNWMHEVRCWLRDATRVAVLTGAGISAESGVPTFRGSGGLWRSYRPEDLATPEAFDRNPLLVWEWYDWRRTLIASAQPNPGHLALVELETRVPSFTLITQNVDGLHARAGSNHIVYLHGDIWTLRCATCGKEEHNLEAPLPALPPKCACGGIQRPGVVWFGEALPSQAWLAAEQASRQCDLFLVIGTSAVVMPAGGLVYLARQSGARVIEINSEETHLSSLVDCSLRGPAGTILPALLLPPPARQTAVE
jgi:NAD-dependent deacetylase